MNKETRFQTDLAERLHKRIMFHIAASCECGAKSPEPEVHLPACLYRTLRETADLLVGLIKGPRISDGCQTALREAEQRGQEQMRERAASLHENINPASDEERGRGDPGAGAMGAVIEYRDKIRLLTSKPSKPVSDTTTVR